MLIETPHEAVLEFRDADADYHALIAIHSTLRGPAIGGTRLCAYPTTNDARADVLRLSQAMSRKTALAGLAAGGGKSVIIAPPEIRSRSALLRAHGRAVESLNGRYITAPDVGLTPADIDVIASETRWVARHQVTGGVDGSDTARGTAAAIRAVVRVHLGRNALTGVRVAVQGCGNVGAQLARTLHAEGAEIIVTDVDSERAASLAAELGASVIAPGAYLDAAVDVLAPCAMGGVFDDRAARVVRARAIAGAANNQLVHDDVADVFMQRGIAMVPDVLASAGGVIAGFSEFEGASRESIFERIDAIDATVVGVLSAAQQAGVSPTRIAQQHADALLERS